MEEIPNNHQGCLGDSVDERNSAPVEVGSFIPLLTRFYTSQLIPVFAGFLPSTVG